MIVLVNFIFKNLQREHLKLSLFHTHTDHLSAHPPHLLPYKEIQQLACPTPPVCL